MITQSCYYLSAEYLFVNFTENLHAWSSIKSNKRLFFNYSYIAIYWELADDFDAQHGKKHICAGNLKVELKFVPRASKSTGSISSLLKFDNLKVESWISLTKKWEGNSWNFAEMFPTRLYLMEGVFPCRQFWVIRQFWWALAAGASCCISNLTIILLNLTSSSYYVVSCFCSVELNYMRLYWRFVWFS